MSRRVLDDCQCIDACEGYRGGLSTHQLAARYGVSVGAIWGTLRRCGVSLRSRSESLRGKPSGTLGRHQSDDTKRKIGDANRGKLLSLLEETDICSRYKSGESTPALGLKYGVRHGRIRAVLLAHGVSLRSQREVHQGELNHFWIDGRSSFDSYPPAFNKELKRSIRLRDSYTCQLCGSLQDDKAFPVHHIDYVKSHNDRTNLVTLCPSCHSKTTFNREYWMAFFRVRTMWPREQEVAIRGVATC